MAAFTSPKAKAEDSQPAVAPEKLAADHFAENDLQEEWQHFLKNLYARDPLIHLAIRDFKLKKTGENEVTIQYPSDTARREFDKVSLQFLADFRVKTNNYLVNFHLVQDTQALRREVVTKKQIFADLVKVNPLLAELDAFLKFDLND